MPTGRREGLVASTAALARVALFSVALASFTAAAALSVTAFVDGRFDSVVHVELMTG